MQFSFLQLVLFVLCTAQFAVYHSEAKACCKAYTTEEEGVSEAEICKNDPSTPGCPPQACCKAYTVECLACSQGVSEAEIC
eukprot:Pgem_evm1s15233